MLSTSLARGELAAYRKTVFAAFSLSLLLTGPFALIQLALPGITLFLFGPAFAGHFTTVQWLMVDLAVVGFFTPMSAMLTSMNLMWFSLGYSLCWSLTYGALCVPLIPHWAETGLAASLTISHMLMVLPVLAYVHKARPEIYKSLPLARGFGVVSLLAALCFVAGRLGPSWGVGTLGVLAAVAIWMLKTGRIRPFDSKVFALVKPTP